jgi:hypothetical protein
MNTVKILDKVWKVQDLEMIARTKKVSDLISEYKEDPNCWASLWIQDEKISDIEKAAFINSCVN